MPFRYTRKIKPDLLAGSDLEARCNKLFTELRSSLKSILLSEHGWELVEHSDSIEARNGIYECRVAVELRKDIENIFGQGMVPVHYIQVSATSRNSRTVSANNLEVGVTQGFQKTFSLIGSAIVGIGGLLVQALILKRISLYLTLGLFIIGSVIGGLIGYLTGYLIGTGISRRTGKMSFDDEVDVGVAKSDWERFIDSILEPVDQLCIESESKPSIPTIV